MTYILPLLTTFEENKLTISLSRTQLLPQRLKQSEHYLVLFRVCFIAPQVISLLHTTELYLHVIRCSLAFQSLEVSAYRILVQ